MTNWEIGIKYTHYYVYNPRDGGAWWAAVYGVAQSQTRLKRLKEEEDV